MIEGKIAPEVLVTPVSSLRGLETLTFSGMPATMLDKISEVISQGIKQEELMVPRSSEGIIADLQAGTGIIIINAQIPWDGREETFQEFIINNFVACAFLKKHHEVMNGEDIVEIGGVWAHPRARRNAEGPKIGAGTEAFASAILQAKLLFPDAHIVSWVHEKGSKQALINAVNSEKNLRLIADSEFLGNEYLLDLEHTPYEIIN